MGRERLAQAVAGHGLVAIRGLPRHVVGYEPVRGGAVEVVGIEDTEGTVQMGHRREDGVGRPPRLAPVRGGGVALRHVVDLLMGVHDVGPATPPASYRLLQRLLQLGTDDQDHAAEAGGQGVVDGVVDERLARRTQRLELLQAVPEPGREAGGQEDEVGLHRALSLPPTPSGASRASGRG